MAAKPLSSEQKQTLRTLVPLFLADTVVTVTQMGEALQLRERDLYGVVGWLRHRSITTKRAGVGYVLTPQGRSVLAAVMSGPAA
jgi:hypothetical protein